ncbi:hypothetical protein GM661_18640 [Iocasia frigidifontis]|uniref:Uncharacterized protein n=1 Tax=Iocasia fonsfrigidae TaxID=2682810 RepID=A0A8A7KLW5_9FIRM|nr:hypothetical protein [Iocasia fonsfrigidae]QTL99827.1 hypothetical protein GM661_18640 [Iocasia fonsfrigidae]
MFSKILYDTRTNKILRCQPKPHGSAPMPSLNGLCKSARISEEEKQYMATTEIEGEMLTNQAQKELMIFNGIAVSKPELIITSDKYKINISNDPTFIITVKLEGKHQPDISSMEMLINEISFNMPLDNYQGSKKIEVEGGTYTIACNDDKFISDSIEVVAVE